MNARELSRAVRQLATESAEEQSKPAIERYADELADMQAGMRQTYTDALAASQWYDANNLTAVVAGLANEDPVPDTPYTKAELVALHTMRAAFVTWAETQLDDIYHVPVNVGAEEEQIA